MSKKQPYLAAITMGSKSDWDTMQHAADMLRKLDIPHTVDVTSAHRNAEVMRAYARRIQKQIHFLVAGAGGSAHLPGMIASFGKKLHVFGVPVPTKKDPQGEKALASMIDMPEGRELSVMPVGKAGAVNAALLIAKDLAIEHENIREALEAYQKETQKNNRTAREWAKQFNFGGGR